MTRQELANLCVKLDLKPNPFQFTLLYHVLNGHKLTYAMPRREGKSEFYRMLDILKPKDTKCRLI